VAEWELEARPRRSVRNAWIVAVLVLAVFTVGGVFLRNGSTGVNFRVVDQIAMVAIGVLVAGGVLLLTRPRVRAGERGIEVRGVLGETLFGWDQVRGVSFPDRKAWARLELADDDYVPLLAIRANDKEHAVLALERLRALGARYAMAGENSGASDAGPNPGTSGTEEK